MKGIILAGGSGTRLHPLTKVVSKQLLPIYDKPMIYYPLSTLMSAGITDILVITTPQDSVQFQSLLGTGEQWGIQLRYATQAAPKGIAEALIIAEHFIGDDDVCLILGDNLFFGGGFSQILKRAQQRLVGAVIFGYYVSMPNRYGVVSFDDDNRVIDITEKPENPMSHYAVPGIYFYRSDVVGIAKSLDYSARGELEITDVHKVYLDQSRLFVEVIESGIAWLDAGTHESLMEASNFVSVVQKRQGLLIGSPSSVAIEQGYLQQAILEERT